MNSSSSTNPSSGKWLLWFRRVALAFVLGLVCGGVLTPFVHGVIYNRFDPFERGWPFCLHVSAFLSSMLGAVWLRSTATVALGVYAGLVGWMLVFGQVEYPVSSAIGLLIHGFIPGALGSATAFFVLWAHGRTSRSRAASKGVKAN